MSQAAKSGGQRELANQVASNLATLTGAPSQQVRKMMALLAMIGQATESLASMQRKLQSLRETPRCLGTPNWVYRGKGEKRYASGMRLVHHRDVERCPFCGERGKGKKRLRPYVRNERRVAALEAVGAQKQYELLTERILAIREALAGATAVVDGELEQVSDILKGVSDDV